MALSHYLTQTITVLRRVRGAKNEYGESAETWGLVGTIVGVIQPKPGNVSRQENGEQITSDGTMYCLSGANIQPADKVQLNDKEYSVVSVLDSAARAHHYEIVLKAVE